jgi:hypothetical protein
MSVTTCIHGRVDFLDCPTCKDTRKRRFTQADLDAARAQALREAADCLVAVAVKIYGSWAGSPGSYADARNAILALIDQVSEPAPPSQNEKRS